MVARKAFVTALEDLANVMWLSPEVITRLVQLAVEQSDRSTVVRKLLYRAIRDWKLEYYAQEYGQGRITLGRAAEEAVVSLWEMMDYVRQRKIPAQYSLEDLEHDLDVISGRDG